MIHYRVVNNYSDTMEDDKFGRWSRSIRAGNPNPSTIRKLFQTHDIATISKIKMPPNGNFDIAIKNWVWNGKFTVSYNFPCNDHILADSLEEAIAKVKKNFGKFIRDVTRDYKTTKPNRI